MTAEISTDLPLDTNDVRLTEREIGQLESADEVIRFFAALHYNVDDATTIEHSILGLDSSDIKLEVNEIRLIAKDPEDGEIVVYLLEVKSVTQALLQKIARRFRARPELALLVLTSDYEAIDFVLLDRSQEKSQRLGQAMRQVIRPRQVTVTRRRPTSVNQRVLSRFTFTEGDSLLQWEKLRSAFTLAEWTEEHFNNRALFSDYYLKSRVVDMPLWKLDVKPIGRELDKLMVTARREFSGGVEETIRAAFYEPIFKLLGFEFVVNKEGSSDGVEPDYYLFARGDQDKPLAAVLSYVWNRNLDDIDPSRDQETGNEIPGALVVSTLESGRVPWVIATNGKLWRLYAAAADNRATNYYEVDLEEAFAAADQVTALKYWWFFFRQEAFTGFLDDVRSGSQAYATELGKRLKNRVFEEIFPHFAEGLIVQMRAEQGKAEIGELEIERVGLRDGEIDLEQVFQATLTFLYRLMFVAYAESLELLPLNEAHGYGAVSLSRLKAAIAEKGGEIEETAPKKLEKAYSPSGTAFYAQLQELFGAIDAGNPALNLPAYNGGLFSAETPAGQLLARYAIPDRYLALGLDRLCRDVDDKTHALVFVDFKSLGVRQLGSVYEGLLEFKLHIAHEKLAVVKEGGKEVYIPFAKAKNKRVQTTLSKGDIYLENDKRERKASGSYYTPDYIVKYIVAHTVGPVLERKFEALTPQLRDAEQRYVKAKAVAEAKREDPEKFWNNADMQQLADACLDIKVLDPAMGSGHFLVEAVDYISDRLIDWLNGWTENPVWAVLERIRRDILEDMERQQVTIPEERLGRVPLLKRAVLKRCIYGVDLNAMAVELAKVSLWLDAFTLGAPLSFLDHHLKQGNSLIGSRIADVQTALAGRQQSSLFASNKFAGVMLATELMRQVSYLSDNTVDQVASSRTAYHSAADYLAPFKRVLDVYTSRWFGNTPARSGFDPVLEFLQRDDVQGWLEKPATPLPANDYMDVQKVAETALRSAMEKRFFHWELEFPEVFFAPSTPGGQDVQLREDGGFDAVVGNPPYIRQEDIGNILKLYLGVQFPHVFDGIADISVYFIGLSKKIVAVDGRLGYITSGMFRRLDYGTAVRKYLSTETWVRLLADFGQYQVFGDATTYPVILILERSRNITNPTRTVMWSDGALEPSSSNTFLVTLPVDGQKWVLVPDRMSHIIRGWDSSITLDKALAGPIYRGVTTGLNEAFIVDSWNATQLSLDQELSSQIIKPYIGGEDVQRWYQSHSDKHILIIAAGTTKTLPDTRRSTESAWKAFNNSFPAIAQHLTQYETRAKERYDQGDFWWELRPCNYYDTQCATF